MISNSDYIKVIEIPSQSNKELLELAIKMNGAINKESHEEIISVCTEILSITTNDMPTYDIMLHLNRAVACIYTNQYENAVSDLTHVIQKYSHVTEAYYFRGVAYFKLSNHEQALNDFNNAIEMRPNFMEAYQRRGELYLALNQKEQADSDFQSAKSIADKHKHKYK